MVWELYLCSGNRFSFYHLRFAKYFDFGIFISWAEWTCLFFFFLHSGIYLERRKRYTSASGLCCFLLDISLHTLSCSSCIWVVMLPCHRPRGGFGFVLLEKIHGLDAELIDVFWGSLVNRESGHLH